MRDDDLIYLFTGTSEIFIKNRMNRIIQGFKNEETTIIKYDMDTSTLTQVLEDALTIPFLEDLKIIIIKNPRFLTKNANTSKDDAKAFIKYLKKPSEAYSGNAKLSHIQK